MRFLKKTSKDLPTARPGGEKSFSLFKDSAAQDAAPRREAAGLDPEVVDIEARAVGATDGEDQARNSSASDSPPRAAPKAETAFFGSRAGSAAKKSLLDALSKRSAAPPSDFLLAVKDAAGRVNLWTLDPAGAVSVAITPAAKPQAVLAAGDLALAGRADTLTQAAAKAVLGLSASQPVRGEAWQTRDDLAVLAVSAADWPKGSKSAAAAAAQALSERALLPQPQDLVVIDLGSPLKAGPVLVFEMLDSAVLSFREVRSDKDPQEPASCTIHELESAAFLAALADTALYKPSVTVKNTSFGLVHFSALAVVLALAAAAYGGYGAWRQHQELSALRQEMSAAQLALAQAQDQARQGQALAASREQLRQLLADPWKTPLSELARLWMPSAHLGYDITRNSTRYTLTLPLPQPHIAYRVPAAELKARLLAQAVPPPCSLTLQPVEKTSREIVIIAACGRDAGGAGSLQPSSAAPVGR